MEINQPQVSTDTVDENLIEKAELDYWKSLKEDLEALEKDERFQRVILESYFRDFVVNQTSMLSHDYTRREGTRPVLMEQLVAVSTLQDYFRTLKMLGSQLDEEEAEE